MRYLAVVVLALALAAPAAAAVPRFGLFDLHDLAKSSRNEFGDVKVAARQPSAGFAVRCAAGCRFGSGWLAFTHAVGPDLGQVRSASAAAGRIGWSLRLALNARGQSAWLAYQRVANRRDRNTGVPDVVTVVAGGRILGAAYAEQVRLRKGVLDLPGFTRANARAAAKSFTG